MRLHKNQVRKSIRKGKKNTAFTPMAIILVVPGSLYFLGFFGCPSQNGFRQEQRSLASWFFPLNAPWLGFLLVAQTQKAPATRLANTPKHRASEAKRLLGRPRNLKPTRCPLSAKVRLRG